MGYLLYGWIRSKTDEHPHCRLRQINAHWLSITLLRVGSRDRKHPVSPLLNRIQQQVDTFRLGTVED